jgi:asparagine synthase (glutamine-hydrolysing)
MCGIAGFVGKDVADACLLQRMSDALIHRGPDDAGQHVSGTMGLAMRRLSIIDVKGGHQPIHNEDRSAWIVFNGEIYNYKELRVRLEDRGHTFYTESDTEVIVHAYEEFSFDCPRYLRGMFAFAIWDARKQHLFLARDRVGKKPLLYCVRDGAIAFASEFRSLLMHPLVSRDVDWQAVHHYLSLQSVPAPHTAFQAIRKLEPGCTLVFRADGSVNIDRYWAPDFSTKIRVSETEAAEKVLEIFRESVRLRLVSEVPIGAFLSGGLDSSAVVTVMSEYSTRPVNTFSIGFDERDFSELQYARQVAQHVGAEHHEFIVRPDALEILPLLVEHYGEPYADSSAIPTYYVCRETRKHVTVALNGDGGDEAFAGYERYAAMKVAEFYRRLPSVVRSVTERVGKHFRFSGSRSHIRDIGRFLNAASLPPLQRYAKWLGGFDESEKRELYSDEFRKSLASTSSLDVLHPWLDSRGAGVLDAVLLTDLMTYLPNDLLVKVDIASMAVSLEARSPFLDHHLIEYVASLPETYKLRRLTSKYLLKKKVLPGLIPPAIRNRRKMGFGVPIGTWLRKPLKQFAYETLLSSAAAKRGLFRLDGVKFLLDEHTSGRGSHEVKLWTLLMLELWFQRFIDRA